MRILKSLGFLITAVWLGLKAIRENIAIRTTEDSYTGNLLVNGTLTDSQSTPSWATVQFIEETVAYDAFTDGGAAAGTYDLATQIPAGALVLRTVLEDVVGFAGDTSAVITVGDGSDADRYNTGTPSVFATSAGGLDLGAVSGTAYHSAAATVTVTVTSNADFTSVNAGSITIRIYYLT